VGSLFQVDANRIAMVAARTIPPVVGVGGSSLHSDRTALCAGTQPTGIEASDDSWCRSCDYYLAGVGLGTRFLFSSLWRAKVRQIFWIPGGSRCIHDLALLQRNRHPSWRRDQFKTEDSKRLRLLARRNWPPYVINTRLSLNFDGIEEVVDLIPTGSPDPLSALLSAPKGGEPRAHARLPRASPRIPAERVWSLLGPVAVCRAALYRCLIRASR